MKHQFSKMLTPILLTLLTVAVTGLDDNLATESKAKAQRVAHSSRLANQLKTRDGHYHYRHTNGYRPSNIHNDKSNQQHYSNYEAPKLQYGPFGSTKDYNRQPTYNPHVPVYPETPYHRPQAPNYDSVSHIYPLTYFTEPPTYAYPQPSYQSSAYSPSAYDLQPYTEAPYSTTTEPQYPPLYYKDLKKVQRPYDAITVTRPTEHAESNYNGNTNNQNEYAYVPYEYGNNQNEYANIPNEYTTSQNEHANNPSQLEKIPNRYTNSHSEYANNQNEYANTPTEYTNNQNEHANNPTKLVKIPNRYANSHNEYAIGNTYKGSSNNHNAYVKIPNENTNNLNKHPNTPNKYANSHDEFENNANDFPKFDDFLKHSLSQFPNFRV